MHGARRIRNRRFADAFSARAVFLYRFNRGFEVSRVVQRVEYSYNAHAVFNRLVDKAFDHVVGIVSVPQKVLTAQQHLYRRLFEIFL